MRKFVKMLTVSVLVTFCLAACGSGGGRSSSIDTGVHGGVYSDDMVAWTARYQEMEENPPASGQSVIVGDSHILYMFSIAADVVAGNIAATDEEKAVAQIISEQYDGAIGAQTIHGMEATLALLLKGKPAKVVSLIGVSDAVWGVMAIDVYGKALDEMKASSTEVWVVALLPTVGDSAKYNTKISAANSQLESLAAEKGVHFLNMNARLEGRTDLYMMSGEEFNGWHLNAEGNKKVLIPELAAIFE